MLDYDSLFALAAVIREGSFERAARSLNVTPSAISQRIKLMEERLGCALVIRGQPCLPTVAGRRLCQHSDRVRLLEQELQHSLPALQADQAHRVLLPLAVNADSLATWFAPVITTYGAQAPVLLEVAVDDQDHTAEWLRNGNVMAAVSGSDRPAVGCNCQPLGAMRYRATASPAFARRYFSAGVTAASLAMAPSMLFNPKDELQARWVRQLCGQHIELPRHSLPSSQAFVSATLAGMGWGMNPDLLVAPYLKDGSLVELIPDTPLDVPLYWQAARASSSLLDGLSKAVIAAGRAALIAV